MCWCFVSFILKRNLGYSHILSEHYLYCTHILSPTTRASNSGITKKAICTVHQQYLSTVWVTFQHLTYQITLPHPYICVYPMQENAMATGYECWSRKNFTAHSVFHSKTLVRSCVNPSPCVQISLQKKPRCALNSKVHTCSHCWHVLGICCTWHLEPKLYGCVALAKANQSAAVLFNRCRIVD